MEKSWNFNWVMVCLALLSACFGQEVLADKTSGPTLAGPDFVALVPKGSVVLVGGGAMPQAAKAFFASEGKKGSGKLVVIPSASQSAKGKPVADIVRAWVAEFPEARVLDCASREEAMRPEAGAMLEDARAVWIEGGDQKRLADLYQGTPVEAAILAVVERGGVVGGTSAGAAILCKTMIASSGKEPSLPVMGTGFLVVPRVIIDQHFTQRNRYGRLKNAVMAHVGLLGLGIDEGTALIVNRRLVAVVGAGAVKGMWSHDGKTVLEEVWQAKDGDKAVDDLPRLWRMAAYDKPSPRGLPKIEKGTVMAVGGGGMVSEVVEKFIELAGGKEGRIVVLPTAGEPGASTEALRREGAFFKLKGAKNVVILTGVSRAEVDSETYAKILGEAKGVWFGGGRQWRFVDAYEGTRALEAMRKVLAGGGVVGGSSAGATILGDYLCRGGPLNNVEIRVPGYDRGLAFLPGVGIDQHFAQRKRFGDMEQFMREQPGYVGLGIDEATALVVGPEKTEVLGPGQVHVYKTGQGKKSYGKGEKVQLIEAIGK